MKTENQKKQSDKWKYHDTDTYYITYKKYKWNILAK